MLEDCLSTSPKATVAQEVALVRLPFKKEEEGTPRNTGHFTNCGAASDLNPLHCVAIERG